MRRTTPLSHLIYSALYPQPTPADPPSFSTHLAKHLVPEVRIETATFYGSLESAEARYPGLNYACAPHRKRLGRFPHHARLFAAFDALRLTESEILAFCRWEGTLWARRRYERDEGVTVVDTTGNEIGPWVDPRKRRKEAHDEGAGRAGAGLGCVGECAAGRRRRLVGEETGGDEGREIKVKTDIEIEIEEAMGATSSGGSLGSQHSLATPLPSSRSAASASTPPPPSSRPHGTPDDEGVADLTHTPTTAALPSFRSVFSHEQFPRTTTISAGLAPISTTNAIPSHPFAAAAEGRSESSVTTTAVSSPPPSSAALTGVDGSAPAADAIPLSFPQDYLSKEDESDVLFPDGLVGAESSAA